MASRFLSDARLRLAGVGAFGVLSVVSAAVLFACSQTPTEVPLRTFERAGRLDTICLEHLTDGGVSPVPQSACAPVPAGYDGRTNARFRLYALVTQTARGELAVADLTSGFVTDQNHPVPGLNFIPVGANPTDVAATPDGRMAFVASAEVNRFAIYGIPGERIVGDTYGGPTPTLSSWPVCALPQRPGALAVVPRRVTAPIADAGNVDAADAGDAGASDAGVDSGAPSASTLAYDLVAILPGERLASAKVVTIDTAAFVDGRIAPGSLTPCPITSAVELVGGEAVPGAFTPNAPWPDGVPWVDGGVDLTCDRPLPSGACSVECRCLPPDLPNVPAELATQLYPRPDAQACIGSPEAGTDPVALPLGGLDAPRLVAVARDETTLYVADGALPLIHVLDMSVPNAPRELPPLVATSIVQPSRTVGIRSLAISPPTRDFKRYLYAVESRDGSMLVFDVTDPNSAQRTPLTRPHPELNPFLPPDRIAFSAPVAAVAFARNDFPVGGGGAALSGILCNPNPNEAADPSIGRPAGPGASYTAEGTDLGELGPRRLRGVFAFATLTDGQIVVIDVDDWDAPCRRPTALANAADPSIAQSALLAPQTAPSDANDRDPYHAPVPALNSVTNEVFFPVAQPHRSRSTFFLRDDPSTGRHVPYLSSRPTANKKEGALPLVGPRSSETPLLLPTQASGDSAGTEPGITFSYETPEVHIDQDWTVTYEGAIPGFDGLSGGLEAVDGYAALNLTAPGHFCAKGVEDVALGTERAQRIQRELPAGRYGAFAFRGSSGSTEIPASFSAVERMADYVQLSDDILQGSDPYWGSVAANNNQCGVFTGGTFDPQRGGEVHQACFEMFGKPDDDDPRRDLPILEAYDDHLVLGRFGPTAVESRKIIGRSASNAPTLQAVQCCFHRQAKFKVRASSQWVTVGSVVGFLNHVSSGPGGRCVSSCAEREALLNARTPTLPFADDGFAPGRDSSLAMRNPAFSFYVVSGHVPGQTAEVPIDPPRGAVWSFSTRGQYTPLTIPISTTTTSLNPQSMRFIETLGQIAVVDAASQGLILVDLKNVALARDPFF